MTHRFRRIVVLGATGHVGGALARHLTREGVEVIRHSSKTLDLTRPEAFTTLDDVMDPDAALVFAAALTPDRGQNPSTFMTNVTMAANLARYLERHPVGLCVYVSSDAVYGFEFNPVTETTPVAPGSYYAAAKYASERVMEYAAAARSVPLLILRVTGVYGPGDPHSAYGPNTFARTLARERTVRLFGGGEEERDHIYVEDVARLTTALLQRGAMGLFNLATGESRSFADIVATIRGLVPYEVHVTSAPRKSAITHRRYEITRLRQVVSDLRFTPFKEGLRATLAAFGAL